jgi:DNA-binding NtrC family response regulator
MGGKVLLVDDDPSILTILKGELSLERIETASARTGEEALRKVEEEPPAAVVLDLHLPDMHGKDVLNALRRERPDLPVVVLSAEGRLDEVVECMRLGAIDYIHKPFDRMRLTTSVKNAREKGMLKARLAALAAEARGGAAISSIIGSSPAIQKPLELLLRAARSEIAVLIEGETGTGKELAARAIHAESDRKTGPFVAINCGAIPESLIESELFGHEKGAFTGATAARPGCFERADGGTIFLDEIGELRSDLQTRLLRVLQEHRVQRLGGSADRPVDIRVVAATNKDLRAEVERRRFREDLYYRLAAFTVRLPPLRERGGDVLLLADAFLERARRRAGKTATLGGFSPEARRALLAYPWPGNVRELENAIERATIVEDGPQVSLASLPDGVVVAAAPLVEGVRPASGGDAGAVGTAGGAGTGAAAAPPAAGEPGARPPSGAAGVSGQPSDGAGEDGGLAGLDGEREVIPLEEAERRLIERALRRTDGNIQEAAGLLGVSRATIYRKLERWRTEGRPVAARAAER